MGRYKTSNALLDAGVIPGIDLTFEAAMTKLMFLLHQTDNIDELKQRVMTPCWVK